MLNTQYLTDVPYHPILVTAHFMHGIGILIFYTCTAKCSFTSVMAGTGTDSIRKKTASQSVCPEEHPNQYAAKARTFKSAVRVIPGGILTPHETLANIFLWAIAQRVQISFTHASIASKDAPMTIHNSNAVKYSKGILDLEIRNKHPVLTQTKQLYVCRQPPDPGNGTEHLPRWFYHYSEKVCKIFIYTGHGGNDNRFTTERHCVNGCVPHFDASKACQAIFRAQQGPRSHE
ncbi:uncharacterized protein LOC119167166 [Rhipicephalus microplus]|uniref:uncharacterized protein LOC119167166 n=1 Tax=Rhipicephalus microplus TaxID=6941 RepID=UPI003F6BE0AF